MVGFAESLDEARVAALQDCLRKRLPERDNVRVVDVTPIAQGASNETYRLTLEYDRDGRHRTEHYVLRPERAEGILVPYDVSRQYRVMEALQESAVPVPKLLCFEESSEALGVPFYLMEYVEADEVMLPQQLTGGTPRTESHARTLRRIHEVDWRPLGLGFLGEPADAREAVEQEIDAWLARSQHRGVELEPRVAALAEWLRRNNAASGEAVLVHGDPNPGNYLFRGTDVVAVVDWELAAISEPRSDLGFFAAIQTLFGSLLGLGIEAGAGFQHAYEEAAGEAVEDMGYFEALGLFKMASVIAGMDQWAPLRPYLEEVLYKRVEELCGPLAAE